MKEGRSHRNHARDSTKRAVVICLGNPLMRDDGVGIRVASELRRTFDGGISVYAYRDPDLSLIANVEGAAAVVLVDALQSGKRPGTVSTYEIGPAGDKVSVELPSLHGLGLPELFDLARQAGLLDCPVTVVGVEPKDCSPGKQMTRVMAAAVPRILEAVTSSLHRSGVVPIVKRSSLSGAHGEPMSRGSRARFAGGRDNRLERDAVTRPRSSFFGGSR